MSHAFVDDPPTTIAEFDVFIAAQRDHELWELVGGRIVAMTNPTELHEQIVANFGAPLKLSMDGQDCRVYFGGMRIQLSEETRGIEKPRPDLLVRCGPVSRRSFITDPLVVAEVLSPSTMDTDRGAKLQFYKRLPTLRHIVLIYQDQMRVEHYRRLDIGWELETLVSKEDRIELAALRFELPLDRLYFGAGLVRPA